MRAERLRASRGFAATARSLSSRRRSWTTARTSSAGVWFRPMVIRWAAPRHFGLASVARMHRKAMRSDDALLRGAIWLTRVAVYLGLFVGVGGAFFVAWMQAPSAPAVRVIGNVIDLVALGSSGNWCRAARARCPGVAVIVVTGPGGVDRRRSRLVRVVGRDRGRGLAAGLCYRIGSAGPAPG